MNNLINPTTVEDVYFDLFYGQKVTVDEFGIEFKLRGYQIDSTGNLIFTGHVLMNPGESKYRNQPMEVAFPSVQCNLDHGEDCAGNLRYPKFKIGSVVKIGVQPTHNYLIVGARCRNINKIELQLMHVHLTPTIITLGEYLCFGVPGMCDTITTDKRPFEFPCSNLIYVPKEEDLNRTGHPMFDQWDGKDDPVAIDPDGPLARMRDVMRQPTDLDNKDPRYLNPYDRMVNFRNGMGDLNENPLNPLDPMTHLRNKNKIVDPDAPQCGAKPTDEPE